MVIKLNIKKIIYCLFISLSILCVICFLIIHSIVVTPIDAKKYMVENAFSGGIVLSLSEVYELPVILEESVSENYSSERFQRPSKKPALKNKYNQMSRQSAESIPDFASGVDVLLAYFATLEEASNLSGYGGGGCGTVGSAKGPYPAAYQMMSNAYKDQTSLEEFEDSFAGIGHMTLLGLAPAYKPKEIGEDIGYYFFETEVITGLPHKDGEQNVNVSLFAYYYGIAETIKEGGTWKINRIYYIPEAFLCAPYHGWWWDAEAATNIIYIYNMKVFDKITDTDLSNENIYLTATGDGKYYMLYFVRLTNGYDILLHEYVKEGDIWKETDILDENWDYYKLSILTVERHT